MSRFQGRRLLLGCTAEGAVLLAVPASTTLAVEVLASATIDSPQHSSVAALCGALDDLQVDKAASTTNSGLLCVTVDDGLARSFVVTPPSGAQGLQELRASAAARFATLYGESAEQWLLAADWQATAPFIACALPRQLYQGLDRLARTHDWRLDSVTPALVRVWNRLHDAIPADGWLVVGFGPTLTLIHTRNDQVAGLRTLRLPSVPETVELTILIEQERLRAPPMPTEVPHRPSLLWAGVADWLPVAPTIAGLASRTLSLRAQIISCADLSERCQLACQLALAGRQ